ncbi:hypothetical protein M501DRAFT_1009108 [Patellaria atrata CBS 101060]|uniref:Zn(2)-C6 fungal-type domain-containing protein n=1 Tax=Patellaria atrata CBS 101060 TaxID=1346257 RepID=A0A9P4S1F8_9PEZI|nr:hypothetical protein M501DRAFT_1009108 [Patellaria atrata CBS 101060]
MSLEVQKHSSHRRNGKLQSCEPCRKGKIRCDHVLPTCGRCARRRKFQQCVYHPAPMTRQRLLVNDALTPASPPSTARSMTTQSITSTLASPDNVRDVSNDARSDGVSNTWVSRPRRSSAPPEYGLEAALRMDNAQCSRTGNKAYISNSKVLGSVWSGLDSHHPSSNFTMHTRLGFLGSTSYSAIIQEQQTTLGLREPEMECEPGKPRHVDREQIQRGAKLLAMLKDLPMFTRFHKRWFAMSHGLIVKEPMVQIWADGIWDKYRTILENQDQKALISLSEHLWKNSRTPIIVDSSIPPREWLLMCTGEGLRWEVVGIIFCLVGDCLMNLPDWDPMLIDNDVRKIDRKRLANTMSEASDDIVTFCQWDCVLDDLVIWLMNENALLISTVKGDASYYLWKRLTEFKGAMIVLGYHQEIKVDKNTPFYLVELRKKTFCQAYGGDKFRATFLGRPPMLSKRYCLIQPPLDLTDKQLFAEGAELEEALASLDSEGWNRTGKLQRLTWTRVMLRNALIREDILEISLGVNVSKDEIISRAQQIKKNARNDWSRLPEFLRQHTFDADWDDRVAPLTNMWHLIIRLEYKYNSFLLERALVKKAGFIPGELTAVAHSIFKDVLLVSTRRDILQEFQLDVTGILWQYGLPCAAVLAFELLRQEHTRGSLTSPLPRSELIQDLSVFIAFLGTIAPTDSNKVIYEHGRAALKRILDKILAPTPNPPSLVLQAPEQMNADPYMPYALGNDADFLQWLDNMEWEKGSFSGFTSS